MLRLLDKDSPLFKDDPVRPELNGEFRTSYNRMSFSLDDRAVVCVALTDRVSETLDDLIHEGDEVAMFYTVWSYDKGAGREIIFAVRDWLIENKPSVKRFVTLSPQTNMAFKFHTRNGAKIISVNDTSINYEY